MHEVSSETYGCQLLPDLCVVGIAPAIYRPPSHGIWYEGEIRKTHDLPRQVDTQTAVPVYQFKFLISIVAQEKNSKILKKIFVYSQTAVNLLSAFISAQEVVFNLLITVARWLHWQGST